MMATRLNPKQRAAVKLMRQAEQLREEAEFLEEAGALSEACDKACRSHNREIKAMELVGPLHRVTRYHAKAGN